jgi:hypothetical protein
MTKGELTYRRVWRERVKWQVITAERRVEIGVRDIIEHRVEVGRNPVSPLNKAAYGGHLKGTSSA